MADNVTLDPGAGGSTIATDDAGAGGHVQIIKLAISADGSATVIGADVANGLDVDVTRVQGTVTTDTELPAAAVLADNTANPTVPGVGSFAMVWDGATWDRETQPLTDTQLRASAVPVSNTVLSVVGGGAEATAQRVTIANDSTGVLSVDDNGGALTVDGTVTADTELPAAAVLADNTANPTAPAVGAMTHVFDGATWDRWTGAVTDGGSTLSVDDGAGSLTVDVGTALPTGTATIGAVNVKPTTSGGLSIFRTLDADETEEDVKTSAGQLYGWAIYNDGATEVYVKFYNATAANVTVGTTTPVITWPIPAGSAANVEFANGIAFSTAITIAATTGVADADVAAPAANQVVANIFYA